MSTPNSWHRWWWRRRRQQRVPLGCRVGAGGQVAIGVTLAAVLAVGHAGGGAFGRALAGAAAPPSERRGRGPKRAVRRAAHRAPGRRDVPDGSSNDPKRSSHPEPDVYPALACGWSVSVDSCESPHAERRLRSLGDTRGYEAGGGPGRKSTMRCAPCYSRTTS
eukprot:1181862-Prorocentrum_minimum.AAC.2